MSAVYGAWPKLIPPHPRGCTACHGMSIGQKATHHAAKVLAATGLELFTDPGFLNSVQDDFVKQVGGRTYKTLNYQDKNPLGKLDRTELHQLDCCVRITLEYFGVNEHQ